MTTFIFLAIIFIMIFIVVYRKNTGENFYKYVTRNVGTLYDKYAPYSFKTVREKVKELGQEYTPRQYAIQVLAFSVAAAVVSYLYFYNLIWCIVYIAVAIAVIPYLAFLRCKRDRRSCRYQYYRISQS